MITTYILNLFISLFNFCFSWIPDVYILPTIGGFDIDSALVTGTGYMKTFFITFWPLATIFYGFLFLLGYYGIKLTLKVLLGSRSPSH